MKAKGDFIVDSIGVCGFLPQKKGPSGVVIVYSTAGEDAEQKAGGKEVNAHFVLLDYPVKRLYSAEDFFAAIARAKNVGNVIYRDREDRVKDIFVCREPAGTALSFVPRDDGRNRSAEGFAEIASGDLKFFIRNVQELRVKPNVESGVSIESALPIDFQKYEKDSLAYAIVNAYNACLLGRVFYSEELSFETQKKERVKVEVRTEDASTADKSVLFVSPVLDKNNFVAHYLTEEFEFIDGKRIVRQRYKINHTAWNNGYSLSEIL